MHGSIQLEHVAESCETLIWIRKMMENSGADNLVAAGPQLIYLLDGNLVHREIAQIISALEFLRVAYTCRADVYASNLCIGPAQSMLCRLRCAAPGDENGMIFPIGFVRPEEMVIRASSVRVFPDLAISFETIDRPWIGITVV